MPIRYMGTKRHMADRVRRQLLGIGNSGPVVDLFSGIGCVAESLVDTRCVITNDALGFTAALAKPRFVSAERDISSGSAIDLLRGDYRAHAVRLGARFRDQVRLEDRALVGSSSDLMHYIESAEHVVSSASAKAQAEVASSASGSDHYVMASLYFSAGYFGIRQTIQLDALRFAIDQASVSARDREWMIGSWVAAAATVINSPGHTAQFLKPNDERSAARIRRYWRRSIWDEFQNRLIEMRLHGSKEWRQGNRAYVGDALVLLKSRKIKNAGVVYADPPYTKDQYSRYYHVYESLHRYDFPGAQGEGRARPDRFSTGFCLKTGVVAAFSDLFDGVAHLGVPLVLSYPSAGLLRQAGADVQDLASQRFNVTGVESFSAEHSTMGASDGSTTKSATENIYVCIPR